MSCVKNGLAQNLMAVINCTVPGLEIILDNYATLPECKDSITASDTMKNYLSLSYTYLENLNSRGCMKPCEQTVFRSKVKKEHDTSWVSDIDKDIFYLRIVYSTLHIEKNVETLVYDTGNFFSTVGGNLGLCLGFSCLSCLLSLVEFISEMFVKFKFTQDRF